MAIVFNLFLTILALGAVQAGAQVCTLADCDDALPVLAVDGSGNVNTCTGACDAQQCCQSCPVPEPALAVAAELSTSDVCRADGALFELDVGNFPTGFTVGTLAAATLTPGAEASIEVTLTPDNGGTCQYTIGFTPVCASSLAASLLKHGADAELPSKVAPSSSLAESLLQYSPDMQPSSALAAPLLASSPLEHGRRLRALDDSYGDDSYDFAAAFTAAETPLSFSFDFDDDHSSSASGVNEPPLASEDGVGDENGALVGTIVGGVVGGVAVLGAVVLAVLFKTGRVGRGRPGSSRGTAAGGGGLAPTGSGAYYPVARGGSRSTGSGTHYPVVAAGGAAISGAQYPIVPAGGSVTSGVQYPVVPAGGSATSGAQYPVPGAAPGATGPSVEAPAPPAYSEMFGPSGN